MKVSDEAKLFAVRQRLLEAERKIYEANKILANIGEGFEIKLDPIPSDVSDYNSADPDPVTGLYPGQLPDITLACEPEENESSDEEVCVE